MINNQINLVVAVTGASGAIYAKLLLDQLSLMHESIGKVAVVFSETGKIVWKHELGTESWKHYSFDFYTGKDFDAPFASGSSSFNAMVVIPSTMGTMARIANGSAEDLIGRAADVMLKEKHPLVIVPRETPLNLIHVENMKTIMLAGGTILPANPSFYNSPGSISDLSMTVVNRALKMLGFQIHTRGWNE